MIDALPPVPTALRCWNPSQGDEDVGSVGHVIAWLPLLEPLVGTMRTTDIVATIDTVLALAPLLGAMRTPEVRPSVSSQCSWNPS